MDIEEQIKELEKEIKAELLENADQLRAFSQKYLGRKGQISSLFDQLRCVSQEDRRAVSLHLDEIKQNAKDRFWKIVTELGLEEEFTVRLEERFVQGVIRPPEFYKA